MNYEKEVRPQDILDALKVFLEKAKDTLWVKDALSDIEGDVSIIIGDHSERIGVTWTADPELGGRKALYISEDGRNYYLPLDEGTLYSTENEFLADIGKILRFVKKSSRLVEHIKKMDSEEQRKLQNCLAEAKKVNTLWGEK